MSIGTIDVNLVEIILFVIVGLLSYLWRTQAAEVKKTAYDLNCLAIKFAEAKGSSDATNKTLFGHIEEMKEAINRVENLLLQK